MVKMILTLSLPTNRRHVSTIQQDHFLLPLSPKKEEFRREDGCKQAPLILMKNYTLVGHKY